MKTYHFIGLVVLFTLFLVACSSSTPTPESELPGLPTPDVPSLDEIDAAIERWNASNTTRYFAVIEERTQDEQWKIHLVVADNLIRSAQRFDMNSEGNWGEPVSISQQEAQNYTIDSVLQRVREDAAGDGPSLFNMIARFDQSTGNPLAVIAESLPSYTDDGKLVLNRQHSYDLTTLVSPLLEDTYGADQEAIFTLIRGGGPEAWCDNLRVFADSSSIYADDCRDEFIQVNTPASRVEMLDELRSSFASLDDLRMIDGQTQRLIIVGTGDGTPDADTLDQAWLLAAELHGLLSEPKGLGLIMSYLSNGELVGFDVFNKVSLPSQIPTNGELRGAVLTPDGLRLAGSDDDGLTEFNIPTREINLLLAPPETGYYLPRSWSSIDQLYVPIIPDTDGEPTLHGWTTNEGQSWQELPVPDGTSGYGCDTGAAWSPDGDILAITGLAYGEPCNSSPGLTIADLEANSAQTIVAPTITSGDEDGTILIAGAHTPAWSPDGSWIAFGLDQDASEAMTFPTRLYRVHPDGSNLTPLTSNSQGKATHPVWAPDGSLYYGLNAAGADQNGLYHYLPDDNTRAVLIPGSGILPLSISPDGEFLLFEQEQVLKIWQFSLQEIIAEITGEENSPPSFVGWIVLDDSE